MTDAWQPIETAPKDENVLVYIAGAAQGMQYHIAHTFADDPDGDWYDATRDLASPFDMKPTHWCPPPLRRR